MSTTVTNKKVPEGLRKLLGEANAKYLSKQYADAKARCEFLIQKHPKLPDPYHLLALIYEELGHNEKALEMYQLAAKNEYGSSDYELWMHAARFAEKIGNITSAFECYKTASQKIKHTKDRTETEEKLGPGNVPVDFYFDCDFEAYEKLAILAEMRGDLPEACNALRFMLRNMRFPRIEHLTHLVHLFEQRQLTPHRMVIALDYWIKPLLLTPNDTRLGSKPDIENTTEEDITSFKKHLKIFEKFLICLMINHQYQKALVHILRFKLFLKSERYEKRFVYLNHVVSATLPALFLALQICCYIFLDKLKLAETLQEGLLQIAKSQKLEDIVYFLISEAYYERSLFDKCLDILKNTKKSGNYFYAVIYDAKTDFEAAIKAYTSVLRMKSPTGKEDFKLTRYFLDKDIDKKVIASRLFCLLWKGGKQEAANKIYFKYELGDSGGKYDRKKLLERVNRQKVNEELLESKLPRLLDLNYQLPKAVATSEETESFGKQFSKRRRIYHPQQQPMNIGATLRRTTKKTKQLKGDLRPHTLQQISLCQFSLKNNDPYTCLCIGLDLIYPFFGNGEKAAESYEKLVKDFPSDESMPDTLLKDDEVMEIFRLILQSLISLNRLSDGVYLAIDLYRSTHFSFDKLKDSSECFGLVVYLCLLSQDFENLGKIFLAIFADDVGSLFSLNENSVEESKVMLTLVQHIMTLHPTNKNLPRILKRVLVTAKQSTNDKNVISLLLLAAQHEAKHKNAIRCLIVLLQARKKSPNNPYINLYLAITYLRISQNRTCNNQNQVYLQGLAYFERYKELRNNAPETVYNQAVYFHQQGLVSLAEKLYYKVLNTQNINLSLQTQAAFGLSSIYYKSNAQLAHSVLERYASI